MYGDREMYTYIKGLYNEYGIGDNLESAEIQEKKAFSKYKEEVNSLGEKNRFTNIEQLKILQEEWINALIQVRDLQKKFDRSIIYNSLAERAEEVLSKKYENTTPNKLKMALTRYRVCKLIKLRTDLQLVPAETNEYQDIYNIDINEVIKKSGLYREGLEKHLAEARKDGNRRAVKLEGPNAYEIRKSTKQQHKAEKLEHKLGITLN